MERDHEIRDRTRSQPSVRLRQLARLGGERGPVGLLLPAREPLRAGEIQSLPVESCRMEISEDAVEDASSRAALRKLADPEGLSAGRRDDLRRAGLRRGVRHGGRPGDSGDGEDGRDATNNITPPGRRRGSIDEARREAGRVSRPLPVLSGLQPPRSRPARLFPTGADAARGRGVRLWARACLRILGLKINVHRLPGDSINQAPC